jgi:hypothetical protein
MSFKSIVEIYCDHRGCTMMIRRAVANKGGLSATFAADLAKRRDGWWVQGKGNQTWAAKAFCPAHHPEAK